jgi:hypothetical protein
LKGRGAVELDGRGLCLLPKSQGDFGVIRYTWSNRGFDPQPPAVVPGTVCQQHSPRGVESTAASLSSVQLNQHDPVATLLATVFPAEI